ncbi:MAG: argininosuccinate lyase [Nitrososphaerota archaeon]|nr:argininosuccinate lyase [Nitrososphaerota archaeon]
MSSSGEGGLYRSRLGKEMDEEAVSYLSSLRDDEEILLEDIEGTQAHVIMLYEQGIISRDEARQILRALEELKGEAAEGKIELRGGFEDIHELIESYIISRVGREVGGKVHSGRSRNDQVALDIRLRVRRYLLEIWREALSLGRALLSRAEEEKEAMIIHYTHLQHAQVGYISHYLLAHLDHLLRDLERLEACYHRVNKSPLGACAIAGSTLPLNRNRVAELLGFDGLVENSVDAVSSRDFALEAVAVAAIMMTNLSRVAEDLIIWSSSEFGYVELPDELASPSSVMPHKKNPCILELLRAKSGKIIGLLTSLLTIMKGTPTGYNRDLQEAKTLIWEALKEARDSAKILTKVVQGIRFREERILERVEESYAPAIELAEALMIHAKLSLRDAHKLVGALVRQLHDEEKSLRDLDYKTLEDVSEKVLGKRVNLPEEDLRKAINPKEATKARKTAGASTPNEIARMLEERRESLEKTAEGFEINLKKLLRSREKFEETIFMLIR